MFRKILFTILCLFVLSGSAFATDYFLVDTNDCANHGDGTAGTCAGAPGGVGAFNIIDNTVDAIPNSTNRLWIRRTFNDVTADYIEPTGDGTAATPAYWIGWPRDALTITSATWTNGSTTVDVILPASMTWSRFAEGG